MASVQKALMRPACVCGSRFTAFAPARPALRRRSPHACRAAVEEPAAPAAAAPPAFTSPYVTLSPAAPSNYIEVDQDFSISKLSFGRILTPVGSALLLYGFASYIQLVPGGDLSSLLLIYGFVGGLLGFALLYAQLDPVPLKATPEAFALRASQMTDIHKQVREDCTRYRYGDEQHLEEALDRIFKFNKPSGVARRYCPKLTGLREETRDGMYTLVLEFTNKGLPVEQWEKRVAKMESFFGPGIKAKMELKEEVEGPKAAPAAIDIALSSDGSGKGRGGGEKKDVLPPLMPGLPARQQ